MRLYERLQADTDVALAFANALETQLGEDSLLTVGTARASVSEVLGEQSTRAISLGFTTADGDEGEIALVATVAFGDALERSAADEIMLSAATPALTAASRALSDLGSIDIQAGRAYETDGPIGGATGDPLIVYPLLADIDPVGCLVVHVATAPAANAAAPVAPPALESETTNGAPLVLADVEMGVTAELGRCRMTIRELLSITPGAVIDLDRNAGAPVDVLVNGKLIARGEVVVIDEEFGIRISEILRQGAHT